MTTPLSVHHLKMRRPFSGLDLLSTWAPPTLQRGYTERQETEQDVYSVPLNVLITTTLVLYSSVMQALWQRFLHDNDQNVHYTNLTATARGAKHICEGRIDDKLEGYGSITWKRHNAMRGHYFWDLIVAKPVSIYHILRYQMKDMFIIFQMIPHSLILTESFGHSALPK